MKTASDIIEKYQARGWTLAAAESCTGGGLLAALTAVPGSSAVVLGGYVTYANSLKEQLGVAPDILHRFGAVSAETAAAMATAARDRSGATIALSVTGIAGPGGGSAEKPVGTVWFGLASPTGTATHHHLFTGDRASVREAAVRRGLALLGTA